MQMLVGIAMVGVVGNIGATKGERELFFDDFFLHATKEGVVEDNIKEWFESNASKFYEGKPQLSRDEALRSGSYLAMSLMLAGQEKGYGSGPMIGFDPDKVAEILKVPNNYVVTVLISMGPLAAEGNWKRKPRLKNVISFDSF